MTSFERTLQLFLNLCAPSSEAHHSRGSLRWPLVKEIARRARQSCEAASLARQSTMKPHAKSGGRPFPRGVDSYTMRWLLDPETFPAWEAPDPLPMRMNTEQLLPVLQHSLQTLVQGQRIAVDVEECLGAMLDVLIPTSSRKKAMHPFLARRMSTAQAAEN